MGYVKLGSPPAIGDVVRNTGEFSTVGVGAAAVTSALYVNKTNRIGAWITGSNVSTGSDADGLFIDTSFAPSSSVTNCASIGLYPTFTPPVAVTITTGYGLYIASGTQGGAGAVTTGYGLFVTHPTFGTANYAAQIDNIRIDVNTIAATNANGTLTVVSDGTGAINIGTNATAHTTTVGSGITTSTTTIDCGTGGANFGTTGNAHTTTVGSTSSTSATTLQSGSGALAVTSANGILTINSGTGAMSISSDASATTVNLATGGAAKVVTLGSTNGASSLALKTGTADFSLASATGTIMSALDTGEITYPLQTAFLAYPTNDILNITGDGTNYTVIWSTEVFDQNSDFDTTTGTLTAPVTGRYNLSTCVVWGGLLAAMTDLFSNIVTSNRSYRITTGNIGAARTSANTAGWGSSVLADMDAADTATILVNIAGSTKTADIFGTSPLSYFSGQLSV